MVVECENLVLHEVQCNYPVGECKVHKDPHRQCIVVVPFNLIWNNKYIDSLQLSAKGTQVLCVHNYQTVRRGR